MLDAAAHTLRSSAQASSDDLVLIRCTDLVGFGARTVGEGVAVSSHGIVGGSILRGAADHVLIDLGGQARLSPTGLAAVEVTVGDLEAVGAGLACGGRAGVLAQRSNSIDNRALTTLAAGRPLAITTEVRTGLVTAALHDGTLTASAGVGTNDSREAVLARQALAAGRTSCTWHDDRTLLVEAWVPTTTLLVIGGGEVGVALAAQATLLGWTPADDPALLPDLGPADAFVVLDHDHEVATPLLADALRRNVGFVGALGSRHTQTQRRERLDGLGLGETTIARLRGPVGLDLGASTPEEVALAVMAEVLARRAGRDGRALSDTTTPIH